MVWPRTSSIVDMKPPLLLVFFQEVPLLYLCPTSGITWLRTTAINEATNVPSHRTRNSTQSYSKMNFSLKKNVPHKSDRALEL